MDPRVVMFTRYPEPGKAKTRLIPALGAAGAAALHRRLTERTIMAVRESGLVLEIRVTGAAVATFADWLGVADIVDQGEGDLGQRLARAAPPYPTIVIGADAPDVTPVLLRNAADALAHAPAVIGPAEDGGYWLLGLARVVPQIFEGIAWSTDAVFQQTVARLHAVGIDPVVLPELADCDRPEDLARWPDLIAP
ncbi:glycosyltransferase [Sphingomonas oligophenolica]|uniref:Glycosyltransferase n=2 Tax=Sphingomonas oligophenolica TaxID=301154 RepID=A0A502CNU8_9SPHN|nr:glycosyltransferase [Sphingomonas oligophenolica]